jgi:hypothetical protein
MKKVILIINPLHIKKARISLQALEKGEFIAPYTFRLPLDQETSVETAVNSIEYLLSGLDYYVAKVIGNETTILKTKNQ